MTKIKRIVKKGPKVRLTRGIGDTHKWKLRSQPTRTLLSV